MSKNIETLQNQVKEYPEEILNNGQKYGFKTANLMFLQKIISDFNTQHSNIIPVEIPSFQAYSNKEVQRHLDSYAPLWKNMWQNFIATFNQENEEIDSNKQLPKILGNKSKAKLSELREYIENSIQESNLGKVLSGERVNSNDLLMVRSTGKEDSTTMANPGGNDSYPSRNEIKNINSAIVGVISSYFGERSLQQRLAAGDDITTPPFTPVLIQKMIGEHPKQNVPERGLKSKSQCPVVSGVMYSNQGSSRIQAAPGHGELIVNSKGNFDNFYITSEGVIYAEKQMKHDRIVSELGKDGKIHLISIPNDISEQYEFSLPADVVHNMYELSKFIEKKYDMPMDTEFAYDRENKILNIVQTRPIPEGDLKGIAPSALDLSILNSLPDSNKFAGSTITKEVIVLPA